LITAEKKIFYLPVDAGKQEILSDIRRIEKNPERLM